MADYLMSRKPFIVTNIDDQDEDMMAQYPTVKGAYSLHRDMGNLEQLSNKNDENLVLGL